MKTSACLLSRLMLAFVPLAALAAEKQWFGGGGSWSDPNAWSPVGVPEAADEVRIGAGSVFLPGTVTVSHRLVWTGGTITGGLLQVAPGGSLEIHGDDAKALLTAAISSAGTLALTGSGPLLLQITGYNQSVVITNEPGGVVEVGDEADLVQSNPSGWPPVELGFVNAGTLHKSGAGTNDFQWVPLYNAGRFEVTAGRVRCVGGGKSTGLFTVAAGAAMDFAGGVLDLDGARFEGEGPARIQGNCTLQGAFTAANFGLTDGNVDGRSDIRGRFEWSGGNLVSAALRLGPGLHRITGPAQKELLVSTLANAGELTVDGASLGLRINGHNQGVSVTNEASGTLTLAGDSVFEQRNPSGWPPLDMHVVNLGTLRSVGPGTNALFDVFLQNDGTVTVASGTLAHRGGGKATGRWQLATGASADWLGGAYEFTDAMIAGAGRARIAGGVSLTGRLAAEHLEIASGTVSGNCEISGGVEWTGGNLASLALRLGPGKHRVVGDAPKEMLVSTLANAGELTLDATSVGFRINGHNQAVTLTNEAGGTLILDGDSVIDQRNPSGWPPVAMAILNLGTIRSSGPGTNRVLDVRLQNDGVVEVGSGRFAHRGGGSASGHWQLAEGTTADWLGGTYPFADATISGAGSARTLGNVTLTGRLAAEHLQIVAGTLAGECAISGGVEWIGGDLVGAALRLGPGQHRISGPDPKELLISTLANAGQLTCEAARVGLRFTGYGQSVLVTNEAGGTLTLTGDSAFEQRNASGWPPSGLGLVNAGTLRSTAGTNAVIATPLHNPGRIEVGSGVLRHDGGGAWPGDVALATDAALELVAGSYDFAGSHWRGPGRARVVGGTTLTGAFEADAFELAAGSISGSFGIKGGFRWTGGSLTSADLRLETGEHWISGSAPKELLHARVHNAGRLTVIEADLGFRFTGYGQSAVLVNETGGALELTDGSSLTQINPSGWPPDAIGVQNAGVLRTAGAKPVVLTAVPLSSTGTLEFVAPLQANAALQLGAAGRIVVRLDPNPVLVASGALELAGQLEASTAPGQQLNAGQAFEVIRAASLSGAFANATAPNPGHLLDYPIAYTPNTVTLTARSAVQEPVSLANVALVGGAFKAVILGPPGLLCRLETSTDLTHWEVQWITNTTGQLTLQDPDVAAQGRRFFRVGLFP